MSGMDDMDVVELRAAMESACDSALESADKLAARILDLPRDPVLVAWAASYVELRKLQRGYRRRLTVAVAG